MMVILWYEQTSTGQLSYLLAFLLPREVSTPKFFSDMNRIELGSVVWGRLFKEKPCNICGSLFQTYHFRFFKDCRRECPRACSN